jgi:hypothetical protein
MVFYPVRKNAPLLCSGDEPRKTSGLLRGEDIIPFRANTGFNAPLAPLETFSNGVNEPPRWKVEDFLTGFTSILELSIPVGFSFIRLRRIPRPWPWRNALMRDIPFQRSIYHASADFAHRWMTHRSLGVGGYAFGGPRACPWGSINNWSYGGGTLEETEIPFSTKVNLEFR